ncbi:serine/threonine-protein kinase [Actinocorallia lasiicapitis]
MRKIADRYQVSRPIGRGGMGEVWEAVDLRLNRTVAVKLIASALLGDDGRAVRRFHREARITARLRHPGVPVLYDHGTDGGTLYTVMERVQGVTVADLIAENDPLPVAWAVFVTAQVCAVLAAAHAEQLVHRDIKPANLIVTRDGALKLLDFGVATTSGVPEYSQITTRGELPGTALYLAPELFEDAPASASSDLYAVGCLLHELLTGARPFTARTPMDEIQHTLKTPPPRVTRADVPPPLADLTWSLLAKTPASRPPSAASVHAALLPFQTPLPPLLDVLSPVASQSPLALYAASLLTALP